MIIIKRGLRYWKIKIKENERNGNILIYLVYYNLSVNFIFRKGRYIVKYINEKKIGYKYFVLVNFMSVNEILKNWCYYYFC